MNTQQNLDIVSTSQRNADNLRAIKSGFDLIHEPSEYWLKIHKFWKDMPWISDYEAACFATEQERELQIMISELN